MLRIVRTAVDPGKIDNSIYWGICLGFLSKEGKLMTEPITGPYETTLDSDVVGGWFVGRREFKSSYRQRRPYNMALNYVHKVYEVTLWGQPSLNPANGGDSSVKPTTIDQSSLLVAQAVAKARDRFNAKAGESASLLITFAERGQAMTMITSRLKQLIGFTIALKKGSHYLAAQALGILKNPKLLKIYLQKVKMKLFKKTPKWNPRKSRKGDARFHKIIANNYLEFHFGWSPLVGDIHSATQILQAPVPDGKTKASATLKDNYLSGWYGYYNNTFIERKTVIRVGIQATVSVTNRNLFLADRLGLLNLAAVPFELVSYSFVLDWFVNVSEFLGQFTENAGLSLSDLHRSISLQSVCTLTGREPWGLAPHSARTREFARIVGPLPFVNLAVRQPWRLSPRRGMAAISLLIQKMS